MLGINQVYYWTIFLQHSQTLKLFTMLIKKQTVFTKVINLAKLGGLGGEICCQIVCAVFYHFHQMTPGASVIKQIPR